MKDLLVLDGGLVVTLKPEKMEKLRSVLLFALGFER
jgi:hypothetical protein